MLTAKLHCWVRTPADSRDCAGSTATIVVPQRRAVALAKVIDASGQNQPHGCPPEFLPTLPEGHRLACGHGATIEYASGRKRRVREYD